MRSRMLVALAALGAVFFAVSAPVHAAAIHGVCTALDSMGGGIYVPLKNATSGMLTEGGPVGATPDSVTLGYVGSLMVGKAAFIWTFGLEDIVTAAAPGGGQLGGVVNPDNMLLTLSLSDTDFKQVIGGGFSYRETLSLTFLANPTDKPTNTPDLLLNHNNYGNYRDDGFGPTDNNQATYTFNLGQDLNLSPGDLENLNTNGQFSLYVAISGRVTHKRAGSDTFTQKNLDNVDDNFFAFELAPEPGTLLLLTLGSLALAARRRKP